MNEGLLWYDDDPGRELAEKIGRAARRYRQKFGTPPDVCYVHPSVLQSNGKEKVGQIHVSSLPSVLRHHFWLGREEKRQVRRRQRTAG
ncbi:MAG: hypothetical protein DRI77_12310 [Chloroflexi bacterium]|nr:MAG: hypothetical protein DRI77_12310 [Chloroflexota bacterium]